MEDNENPITRRNAEQSPLLRLPAKLRTKVYIYAIGGYTILLTSWVHSLTKTSADVLFEHGDDDWIPVLEPAALHYTCRQTRQETVGMHFALNTFCATLPLFPDFICHHNLLPGLVTRIVVFVDYESFEPANAVHFESFSMAVQSLSRLQKVSIVMPQVDWMWPGAVWSMPTVLGLEQADIEVDISWLEDTTSTATAEAGHTSGTETAWGYETVWE